MQLWRQATKIRFKHVDTQFYLHSHDVRYGNPIANQAEVMAMPAKGKGAEWQAAEGVYYPMPSSEDDKEEL